MLSSGQSVLVTSAGRKVPLIKAIQQAGKKIQPEVNVIAGDTDETAIARYVADDFWHMPPTTDREAQLLLSECLKRGIKTIVPTRDGELMFWARHRRKFVEEGIDVLVSSEKSIAMCLDKLMFAQFGNAQGLPFIKAGLVLEDVGQGPYVVKERYGAGSHKIGINMNREAAIQHGVMLDKPIYQRFIEGHEISVDAWLDKNCLVKGLVLRSRDKIINGESQVTTTFRNTEIEQKAEKILNALKLRGPVVMQAIIDHGGGLNIIECNTRIGGASTASIAAGLDIFYWSLLESKGVNLDSYPFERIKDEIRQIRVPSDIYVKSSHF